MYEGKAGRLGRTARKRTILDALRSSFVTCLTNWRKCHPGNVFHVGFECER